MYLVGADDRSLDGEALGTPDGLLLGDKDGVKDDHWLTQSKK